MKRAARTDSNHAEIRDEFRARGCLVADTHGLGAGFPDLVIQRAGTVALVEVKDGSKCKSAQALTADERAFAEKGWKVHIVRSKDDALALVNSL